MEIPFSKIPIAGNEMKYLKEVVESGWFTTSSKAHLFEDQFRKFVNAKFACAVNSCTSALHLAVEAIGIRPSDKVLVPSLTFTASAEVLRYMGADPVFIDVEYGTGLITSSLIKDALQKHKDIKAIVLVHYGGQAVRMSTSARDGVLDLCREYNITVIEDAAHAFPTRFNHQYVGSFGDVTCFSFYANKTITTGEGGMLVTDNEEIFNRAKIMRLHGIDRDIWRRFTSKKSSWEYDIVAPGYKYNMPDINAAIGLAQLERAEYFREQRQRCAEFYYNELSEFEYIDLPLCEGSAEDHAWHLFPIVIKPESKISRNTFIEQMGEYGIRTSVHYKPLHRMSYYRDTYNLVADDFPNTERMWKGLVSLPIYPDLTNKELGYICQTIKTVIN